MARFLTPKGTGNYRLGFDALDGDVQRDTFVDPVPDAFKRPNGVTLSPRSVYGGGSPVSPDNLPTKMRLSGRKTQLHDFNSAYHMFLVSRRFVDVVQRFQSDIQCAPVSCIWKDGTLADERFFFFTTLMLDAVDREKTTATWKQLLPDRGVWRREPASDQIFTFDRSRLGGAHMWVDPNMPEDGALVSDQLWAALREAEIESFYDCPSYAEV